MNSGEHIDELFSDFEDGEIEFNKPIISQWAESVLDFSSQYGSNNSISYSAINSKHVFCHSSKFSNQHSVLVCGKPSKYPNYGDYAESFACRNYGPHLVREFSPKDQSDIPFHDFIIVKYENYVLPQEIKIYETYNPGALVRIYAYCCVLKKWELLYERLPAPVEKKAREFCPPIKKINTPVR